MNAQGMSLGRQLAEHFAVNLANLCSQAEINGSSVWFLGRDCDVFAEAFGGKFPNVRYITGLNRDNARHLQHRHSLAKWLKSLGVKAGDIIVDSGFSGSIYERIERDDPVFFQNIRCILLTANEEGFTGEPLTLASICNGSSKMRHCILALEHSPKREVCDWDEKRRVPKVRKAESAQYRQACRFFDGCVKAIKEAIM